ncbi:MAG: hypothetical protein KatS3mg105_0354 [Gemmatales bacterium]|nr:MAG: hypothetical protein KatS3mg105_0354 [Gemmatales bacterium]
MSIPQIEIDDRRGTGYFLPCWYAVTLFISAWLLFSVQPMIGKLVLPLYGGTPAVWNTCLVFFQAGLLAGYLYAHGLVARFSFRQQRVGHGLMLMAALLGTPLLIRGRELADFFAPPVHANPVLALLLLLVVFAGIPFVAVAATAPLLQSWFSQSSHNRGRDPYFLYAASNLGSMVALLAYPFLLEPYLPLESQLRLWMIGLAALMAFTVAAGFVTTPRPNATSDGHPDDADIPPPSLRQLLHWLLLAFVPASLLFGVTTFLCTDVAAVPLLWILPLTLYLLTFVLVFAPVAIVRHETILLLFPLAVLLQTFVFSLTHTTVPIWCLFLFHLGTFFVVVLACHGELARQRPASRFLTEFYLCLAAGGLLGGMFNTLVAPSVFPTVVEYPLALVMACAIVPLKPNRHDQRFLDWQDLWLPLLFYLGLSAVIPLFKNRLDDVPLQATLVYGLPAALCLLFFAERPIRFALAVGAILLTGGMTGDNRESELVFQARNFFAVVRVIDVKENGTIVRRFVHGTTLHGMQFVDEDMERRNTPLAYYFRDGPIGELFAGREAFRRVAVLGLGAGALASYAKKGESWTFFEVDPAVEYVARHYFTFLSDAKNRGAEVEIVLGDARLQLERYQGQPFDLIIADAFSSDAVPTHLLTREAVRIYLDHLSPQGLLLFNITNRHLDLEPVVAALALDAGLEARVGEVDEVDEAERKAGKSPSRWVVLARTGSALGPLQTNAKWQRLKQRPGCPLWTDDYSNLIQVIR